MAEKALKTMRSLREIIEEFAAENERSTYNRAFFNTAILKEAEPAHFSEAMEQILRISLEIENLRASSGKTDEGIEKLSNDRLCYINLLGYISRKDPGYLLSSLESPNVSVKQFSAMALISFPNRKAVPVLKRNLIETENETLGEIFRIALEACRSRRPLIVRILIGLISLGGFIKLISLFSK